MAIYVIDGYPGSGKTAFATKWLRTLIKHGEIVYPNYKVYPEFMKLKKYYSKENGKKIFKNIEGNVQNKEDRENKNIKILYWKHFDDWQFMKEGTIFCDESILYFNARNWDKLPDEMQLKLVQHRHEKLDLVLTVQHYSRIDIMLRQMCEKFYHVELLFGSTQFKKTILPRIARISEYHLEDMEKLQRIVTNEKVEIPVIASQLFWIKQKIFKWYNTAEMVGGSKPMLLKRNATHYDIFCEKCGILKPSHSH